MPTQPHDPLDPQREAVYASELAVFPRKKDVVLSLEELNLRLDEIQDAPWFERAFPYLPRAIILKDGRGEPWARGGQGIIHLIKASRVLDVLVHEIGHNVLPSDIEWHGSAYAGMLLFLIGKVYDEKTKGRLRYQFRKRGVSWDKRLASKGTLGDIKRLEWPKR